MNKTVLTAPSSETENKKGAWREVWPCQFFCKWRKLKSWVSKSLVQGLSGRCDHSRSTAEALALFPLCTQALSPPEPTADSAAGIWALVLPDPYPVSGPHTLLWDTTTSRRKRALKSEQICHSCTLLLNSYMTRDSHCSHFSKSCRKQLIPVNYPLRFKEIA